MYNLDRSKIKKPSKSYDLKGFNWSFQKIRREEGIRTLDAVTHIQTFQACSFNHSDTSLLEVQRKRIISTYKRPISKKIV